MFPRQRLPEPHDKAEPLVGIERFGGALDVVELRHAPFNTANEYRHSRASLRAAVNGAAKVQQSTDRPIFVFARSMADRHDRDLFISIATCDEVRELVEKIIAIRFVPA